ncbi:chromosome segregation protein SMC [Fusobacterium sp. IOR10]|uniref:chromosome segregation protein SMC n=1 Tax=Fusobacterium sp. IOR10 TaxID=2665157 RepID=UPI0013D1D59A|nr:chromosome segregation protein SMC [Fusobacterium sp. IOR10]
MYLKSVEIYGFKSFGEKIKIDFSGGITSIVGPNGSGKSNILDSILWVLGEQSYKNIRAKESKDVIFSGEAKKNGASYAEVSLTIDNKDRFFQIESEVVKITRKLHKTGENEYLINDKKSRLRDISDLFMDTGVGKSAYSVIGQGKVERIISSSKKEIKEIIEEAAGVKKYQTRKLESEKKLINVTNEVEKIELILNETNENRIKIKKQADKALAFLELKKERDSLSKGLIFYEIENNKDNIEISKEKVANISKNKSILEEEKRNKEKILSEIILDKEKIKQEIKDSLDKNEELKNLINNFENEKTKLLERSQSYNRELGEKEENLKVILNKKTENLNRLEILNKERQKLEFNITSGEENYSKFQEKIKIKDAKKIEIEKKIETNKRKILDYEVMKLQQSNDIENSEKRMRGSNSRIKAIERDLLEIDEKINLNEALKESARKNGLEKKEQLLEASKKQENCEEEISRVSIESNRISEELRRDEREEISNRRKYEQILRFEENNEGFYKGVKEILNEGIKGVEGALISIIKVPEKYEKAIEASISGNLQDIVVENSGVAKKCINILKERKVGKASFLALDTIKTFGKKNIPKIQGIIGRGSELINYNLKYKKVIDMVLSNLLVVENIDIAVDISRKNLFSGNIVTLQGEYISGSGRITGGSNRNSAVSQMFERRKESKRLEKLLIELTARINENKVKQEKYSKKIEELENKTHELDILIENLRKNVKIYHEEFENLKLKEEKLLKDKNIYLSEKEEEENYAKEYKKKIESSSAKKEDTEKKTEEIKNDINKKSKELEEVNNSLIKLKDEFSDMKIKFLNSKDRIVTIKNDISNNKKEKLELEENEIFIKERISKLLDGLKKLKDDLKRIDLEREEKNVQFDKENINLQVMKEKNELLDVKEKEYMIEIKENENHIYKEEERLKAEKERLVSYNGELNILNESLKNLEDIVHNIKVDRNNYKVSMEKIKYLDNKLKFFETVNLLAVEEFKELDRKYKFIKNQKDDLENSKNSLLEVIEDISANIEKRFFDAYENINQNFNFMCMETIDNSEGNLTLVNKEDYENCGVEIYVKFKDKKRQSLTLLSGGEKSMVAIAFIIAIFMYKPSPFTFLDEIEAALDEKNTKKLISKLKEFTDKSQFILITHNKETMRSSDSLFGVTMNKKIGISKIVPVKL